MRATVTKVLNRVLKASTGIFQDCEDEFAQPHPPFCECEQFLISLNHAKVLYTVVEGFAVCINGYPRMRDKMDILIEDSPENLKKLSPLIEAHENGLQLFNPAKKNECVRTPQNFPINIFTKISDKKFIDFIFDNIEMKIGKNSFSHLAPKALIELKKNSWREKDQLYILQLQILLRKQTQSF